MIIYQVYPKTPIFVRKQLKLKDKFTQFDSSSFLITTDVEKKLFDMVVLLKSEVWEFQINDQKFKEKIANLKSENEIPKKIKKKVTESQKSTKVVEIF